MTGTWQIAIPSAHIRYSLSVGGLSGNVTVSASQAGSSIPVLAGCDRPHRLGGPGQ